MRVIEQNNPGSTMNQGTVIFHAGANIARRWEDFQEYSEADQQFFDQLLPMEKLDFSDSDELSVEPRNISGKDSVNVRQQTDVQIEEIPLLREDTEAMKAIRMLRDRGYSAEEVSEAMRLEPVPTTRVRVRQAKRSRLDETVKTEAGRIIADHGLNAMGHDLDKARLGKTNFVVVKSSIDKAINKAVGRKEGERNEFSRAELDKIEELYTKIVESVEEELFDAQT